MFRVGERNHTVFKKILWQNGIIAAAEDVGGTEPRTLNLRMQDGVVTVRSKGVEGPL